MPRSMLEARPGVLPGEYILMVTEETEHRHSRSAIYVPENPEKEIGFALPLAEVLRQVRCEETGVERMKHITAIERRHVLFLTRCASLGLPCPRQASRGRSSETFTPWQWALFRYRRRTTGLPATHLRRCRTPDGDVVKYRGNRLPRPPKQQLLTPRLSGMLYLSTLLSVSCWVTLGVTTRSTLVHSHDPGGTAEVSEHVHFLSRMLTIP